MISPQYQKLLFNVEKPSRYAGNEYGSFSGRPQKGKTRICFCFPDLYEIGMSNLGMKILVGALNNTENVCCERCYAPWTDMAEQLKNNKLPLYALESGDSLADFDILAFTLQYELSYTNVLYMLKLAGIPLYASQRGNDYPLVIAGGPCAYNPEPMADFVDIFSIGEGEEALPELARLYGECKKNGDSKEEFLFKASQLDGFYVPSLYKPEYNKDGSLKSFKPIKEGVPATVTKRIIKELDNVYYPNQSPLPFLETVHDRVMLEVFRGCIRGCRFCQAGMTNRPYREKSPEVLNNDALQSIDYTGCNEIALTSLSISDYTRLSQLTDKLLAWTESKKINLSLPSMRIDSFYGELYQKVSSVRKSGLTFAPEAGTQRLRDVINKNITEQDILSACSQVFAYGRDNIKLYFMNGLPTETDEDTIGIANLAQAVVEEFFKEKRRGRRVSITVSVSCFVPKPHTPFQWEGQTPPAELARRQKLLRDSIKSGKISYKYHDASVSRIEAVFARGDRKLSKALYEAAERGVCFDGWDEKFSYEGWLAIFDECGIDPYFYANREIPEDELLPWDFINAGVTREFLVREHHLAKSEKTTPDCRTSCAGCGNKDCALHKKANEEKEAALC